MKPFFIVKDTCILEDYRDLVIKSGCTLACTKNGWSNNDMALEYIQHFAKHNRPTGIYTLLILDGHGSHATFRFRQIAYENNIILLYLPPHTTHNLQPLDVGLFSPQSIAYGKLVEAHSRFDGVKVSQREYLKWILEARQTANTTENILSAWRESGLAPFNPNVVLLEKLKKLKQKAYTPDPHLQSTLPTAPLEIDSQSIDKATTVLAWFLQHIEISSTALEGSIRPHTPIGQITFPLGTLHI
jgi:hypothetical protein